MIRPLLIASSLLCISAMPSNAQVDHVQTPIERDYEAKLSAEGFSNDAISGIYVIAYYRAHSNICGDPDRWPASKIEDDARVLQVPLPIFLKKIETYYQLQAEYVRKTFKLSEWCNRRDALP